MSEYKRPWYIDQNEVNFYQKIMPELSVVFDVGCRGDNIFYELNNDLEVHLFEPMSSPEITELQIITESLPNVKFNNFGLDSVKGEKVFYTEYQSLSTAWHKLLNRPKNSLKLKFDTLKNYINENGIKKIDLLKIDTEAWDFEVMKGAEEKIWDITYIQFEAGWPTYGESDTMEDILNYFDGYNIYNLGGGPENYVITKKTLHYPKIR